MAALQGRATKRRNRRFPASLTKLLQRAGRVDTAMPRPRVLVHGRTGRIQQDAQDERACQWMAAKIIPSKIWQCRDDVWSVGAKAMRQSGMYVIGSTTAPHLMGRVQ